MKLENLIDFTFLRSLEIVAKTPVYLDTAYKVLEIKDKVIAGTEKFTALRKTLIEKFGKKDASGALLTNDAKTEYVMEDQAGFDSAYQELMQLEIELPKLSRSELKEVKISAEALKPLRAIITD